MENVSKIEIAKALKTIRSISTHEQLESVINVFSKNTEDKEYFHNAIKGLSEEDEFALLTKLMETATRVVGLDQRPIIEGDYIIPDFLVSFKPNCMIHRKENINFSEYNCFVEVKSTSKDKFKIGGSRLRKLRDFSDKYALPLIIAIRFTRLSNHAFWAFIEDDRSKTSINATYNDCIQGVRHILWDEYNIMIHPNIVIIAEYNLESENHTVSHSTYGRQEKLIIKTPENELIIEDIHLQTLYSAFFECFNLEPAGENKVNEKITQQALKPTIELLLLSDIVYRINRLSTNKDGSLYYDASKILASIDAKDSMTTLSRSYIDSIFMELADKGFLFLGGIKDIDEHLVKWKKYGNINN